MLFLKISDRVSIMRLYDEDFEVYIPTYDRAGLMTTHKVLPNAIIVCPESQEKAYRLAYPMMKIKPCPDSVEGNMAKKRNWIKDHAEKKWFIMVDDDIKYFQMIENGKQIEMDYDHVIEFFHNGFIMAEELGTVLWGINLQTDPKFYREYSPFSFLSVVLGPFTGHIKSSLRYDESLPTKEDYDYALQVLHKYHKILRFNKYSYMAGHINNEKGGSISIRRMEMEKEQAKIMERKWGKVVKFDFKKDIDPKVKIPLKGI
jgi:hypothetical protein